VRAFQYISADLGANTPLVDSLLRSNEAHKHYQFSRLADGLAPKSKVLLVGLAFKAETDDLRESPSVDLARKLLDNGHSLEIYDPSLTPEKLVGQNLGYAYAYLPTIDSLLVDKVHAETQTYDLIIATNKLVKSLDVDPSKTVDVSAIP
jgi:GDP-mannose 6-dehydrogenase